MVVSQNLKLHLRLSSRWVCGYFEYDLNSAVTVRGRVPPFGNRPIRTDNYFSSLLHWSKHLHIGHFKTVDKNTSMGILLISGITRCGNVQHNEKFFDTLLITPADTVEEVKARAEQKEINLRYFDDGKVRNYNFL